MGEGGELRERVRAGEREREGECRWGRERERFKYCGPQNNQLRFDWLDQLSRLVRAKLI